MCYLYDGLVVDGPTSSSEFRPYCGQFAADVGRRVPEMLRVKKTSMKSKIPHPQLGQVSLFGDACLTRLKGTNPMQTFASLQPSSKVCCVDKPSMPPQTLLCCITRCLECGLRPKSHSFKTI